MDRLEQYRIAADDCRQMAARSHVPKHQERWLRIAERWTSLAKEIENDPHRHVSIIPEQPQARINRVLVSSLLSELSDEEKAGLMGAGM